MTNTSVSTDKAPSAIGPYSQAIKSGTMLFVSGQIGIDPETGKIVGPDFSDQAVRVMNNLKAIITHAGYELTDITAVDVYVTDMNKFAEFNEIYGRYFSEYKPARAVVQVSALPLGSQVEVKCIANKS